jgi:hypothetical protein
MNIFEEIQREGFVRIGPMEPEDVTTVVELLLSPQYVVSRNVYIGMADDPGSDLIGTTDDFFFHSDGCFLTKPPELIAIYLHEKAGTGGDFELLSIDDLPAVKNEDQLFRFGHDSSNSVVAKIIEGRNLRFRLDYMTSLNLNYDLVKLRKAIESSVSARRVPFAQKDLLIIDNQKMLHRRGPFNGRRAIRRLWLHHMEF